LYKVKGVGDVMKRKILLLISLFLIINFMLVVVPRTGYACSCAESPSVEEELKQKTAVFSGKVIKIEEKNKLIRSSADPVSVLFEVKHSWKGVNQSQVMVYTAMSSASCGYEFNLKTEYLVYAYGEENHLITSICDRTKPLLLANDDLAVLGEGTPPTLQVDLENPFSSISPFIWALIAVPFLVIAFVVRMLWVRR
jgi:hypothetical protein